MWISNIKYYLCIRNSPKSTMSQKRIEELTFEKMREILFDGKSILNDNAFLSDDLALLRGNTNFKRLLLTNTPYRIEDIRIGIIKQGELKNVVNLQKHDLKKNTISFLGKGSIIELRELSPDLQIIGIAFQDIYLGSIGKLPTLLSGEMQDLFIEDASNEEIAMMEQLLDTTWRLVHQPRISKETIGGMVKALVHYLSDLCREKQLTQLQPRDNDREIFERFIHLVNLHCRTEHHLPFYAEKLFLSPHYVSQVVKKVSGLSAKDWIDRALITETKVMLKHTHMRAVQISYELNFPNPSFFSKFFKQHTGITPEEYRKG